MKYYLKYISACMLALFLAACTQDDALPPQTQSGISLTFNVIEMKGETMQTRALFPLKPETENMIRTLSLLVFDEEEQHYIGHTDYYRYLEVADTDAPNGQLTVYEPQYGGNLGKGMLCAVANMNEKDLLDALRKKAAEGGGRDVINLNAFKELTVDLPYYNHADSVGLVKDIYMFGYYEGDLKPYESANRNITISLGRIISRLNLELSVDEDVAASGLQFAIRLGNTNRKAYIFPGNHPVELVETDPYFAPVELKPEPRQFYYYVGPHSFNTQNEATYVEIAYGKSLVYKADGTLDTNQSKTVKIEICNDPPGTENRNYQLNRNSTYQIAVKLVKKGGSSSKNTRTSLTQGISLVELDVDNS